jgi:hypothetical protein
MPAGAYSNGMARTATVEGWGPALLLQAYRFQLVL